MNDNWLSATVEFLNDIGIPTHLEKGAKGFLDGVVIRQGSLFVDTDTARASNLLHEAGHLACIPGQFRQNMSDNLMSGLKMMYDRLDHCEPDSPLFKAIMQCSDPEATAWAWAAGKSIGIPDELIIEDQDYDGEGLSIRLMLQLNRYAGINGLSNAGFCKTRQLPNDPSNAAVFPQLNHWLQPDNLARICRHN